MSKIPDRTVYENELANLLQRENEHWVAMTSGNNQGWDVTLMQQGEDINWCEMLPIEVKTSIKKRVQLTAHKREREQVRWYKNLWWNHTISTYYAFRRMGGSPVEDIKDRWRFFHIENVGKGITWSQGMTYQHFVDKLRAERLW